MSTKRKLLGQPAIRQSAKNLSKGNLDESRTVVSGGGNSTSIKSKINGTNEVVDISSDSGSSESADEEEDEEEGGDAEDSGDDAEEAEDTAMQDTTTADEPPQDDDDDDEANAEPSFGDLIRANNPADSAPIDVAAAFQDPSSSHALAFPQNPRIQPPSGASLGTVLTQALKTNDIALLESCLHTTDVNTIRATIQRLQSPLAGTLLQKLAERLHKRPGRAGSLMVWVQWTLVTHGGFLATQRDLITKLADLNRVIDERAKGLHSLLSLKGKLDMLEAQMELRRSMQNQRKRAEENDDEDGVIYVEGMESDEGEEATEASKAVVNGISDAESEISEDMPMTNGVIADSEDDEEDDSEDDNLLDDEAEETDADTGDEDDVDHDDVDSNGDEEESDDGAAAAPAPKRRR